MGWLPQIFTKKSGAEDWLSDARHRRLQKSHTADSLEVFSMGGDVDLRTKGLAPLVMNTIWSYVAIRTIVNNARTIPITPQIWDPKLQDFVEVGPDNPLYKLVSEPNELQLWDEFLEATIAYLKIFGDVPIHIQTKRNLPMGFFPMRPDMTSVHSTKDKIVAGWRLDRGAGGYEFFQPDEVAMIREFNPIHPIRGHGASRAAQQSLLSDFHSAKYNVSFFKNHTLPGAAVTTEQRLTISDRRRLRANLRAAFGGSSKGHSIAIMSKGVEVKSLTPTHKDMDFQKLMQDSMLRTLLAFGVPPGVAGVVHGLTNSNLEAQRHLFLVNTLQPTVDGILQKLNKAIFNRIGMRLIADFESVLVSEKTRHERAMEARGIWRDGLITRDEARIKLGDDPIGGEVGAEFFPITASNAMPTPELGSNLQTDDDEVNRPGGDPSTPSTDVSDDPTGTIKQLNQVEPAISRLPFDYFNVPQNGTMPELPVFKIS